MNNYLGYNNDREYYKTIFNEVIKPSVKYTVVNPKIQTVSEYDDQDYRDISAVFADVTVWFDPDDKHEFLDFRIDGNNYFIVDSSTQLWVNNNIQNLLKNSAYELTYSVTTEQNQFVEGISLALDDYLYEELLQKARKFQRYI